MMLICVDSHLHVHKDFLTSNSGETMKDRTKHQPKNRTRQERYDHRITIGAEDFAVRVISKAGVKWTIVTQELEQLNTRVNREWDNAMVDMTCRYVGR